MSEGWELCVLAPGSWDVECYLAGGEGAVVGAGGEKVPTRYGWVASMHSTGSGTKLLERGWTLSFSGVTWCRLGGGILTSPRLSTAMLEFSPLNERVAFIVTRVAGGRALLFVLMHRIAAQNTCPSWSVWVGSWKGFHQGTPYFFLETSTLMWATMQKPGGG